MPSLLTDVPKEMELDTSGNHLTPNATVNMQSKLLVAWFCIFSGDMTQQAISASGLWATVCVQTRVYAATYC